MTDTTTLEQPKEKVQAVNPIDEQAEAEAKEIRHELHIVEIGESLFKADVIGPWCHYAKFAFVSADGMTRVCEIAHCEAPDVKPNRLFAHWDPCVPEEVVVHWPSSNQLVGQSPMFAGFAFVKEVHGKETI